MTRRAVKYLAPPPEKLEKVRQLAALNSQRFIESRFKIPEDKSGRKLDFRLNWSQQQCYNIFKEERDKNKPIRLWILKSRRAGITSLFAAVGLADAWANENRRIGILAHRDERSRQILQMCKYFYKNLPAPLQLPLSKDATSGIKFAEHDSQLLIATCTEAEKVRGDGLHYAHLSEAAFYGNYFASAMNEVATTVAPEPETAIIIETTGKSRGSSAHKHWEASDNGETQFRTIFLPWHDDPTAIVPFESDLLKDIIISEVKEVEPRILEKCRLYKLKAEQTHWAYKQFVFRCNLDYDYFCREFPFDREEAWTSSGSSFFGDIEISLIKPDMEYKAFGFKNIFINQMFKSLEELEPMEKVDDNASATYIKQWNTPHANGRYVIGSDVSLGEANSTFSAGYVLDMSTREMMAMYHGRLRPDEHAFILASLGNIYNNAMLAPEINPGGGGMALLTDLQRIGYYNIYIWRKRDSKKGLIYSNSLGWLTNRLSRPLMLGELRRMFQDCAHGRFHDPGMFRDKALLSEMRSFHVDPESSIPCAAEDAYDDRIIALAITHRAIADEVHGGHLDIYSSYAKVPDTESKFEFGTSGYKEPQELLEMLSESNFKLKEGGEVEWQE